MLKRLVTTIDQGSDQVHSVSDRSRIELDYYRNTVLSILAPDCLVATALAVGDDFTSYESLSAETRRLSYWFRLEFIYETDTTFEDNFKQTVERLADESLIELGAGGIVRVKSQLAIDFLRGMMLHLVEAYWAAADALRTLVAQPMERNQWLEFAREHAEKEFIQGDIRRAEAASTVTLKNALELYLAEGLVRQTTSGTGRKRNAYSSLHLGDQPMRSLFDEMTLVLSSFGSVRQQPARPQHRFHRTPFPCSQMKLQSRRPRLSPRLTYRLVALSQRHFSTNQTQKKNRESHLPRQNNRHADSRH